MHWGFNRDVFVFLLEMVNSQRGMAIGIETIGNGSGIRCKWVVYAIQEL